jgi:hypothetical protein
MEDQVERVTDLLPALKGEGSYSAGGLGLHPPSSRGFNPRLGLQPVTPIPDGTRGYEYIRGYISYKLFYSSPP